MFAVTPKDHQQQHQASLKEYLPQKLLTKSIIQMFPEIWKVSGLFPGEPVPVSIWTALNSAKNKLKV